MRLAIHNPVPFALFARSSPPIHNQYHSHALQHIDSFRGPYLNDYAFELFEAGSVDGLFNDYIIDGIKINIGIWRSAFSPATC
jgi:hypothetical protein